MRKTGILQDTRFTESIPLACWGLFFAFIVATGRLPLYINPRFTALPIFGALILFGMVVSVWYPKDHTHGDGKTDWSRLAWFVMPVALGIMIAPAALGAFFVHKAGGAFGSAGGGGIALNMSGGSGFNQTDVASLSQASSITSGKVDVQGQIYTGPGMGPNQCALCHYKMTCCVADLQVVQIILQYPKGYTPTSGQWVDVQGTVSRTPAGVVVNAEGIAPIDQPNPPYLY